MPRGDNERRVDRTDSAVTCLGDLERVLEDVLRNLPGIWYRIATAPPWRIEHLAGDITGVSGLRLPTVAEELKKCRLRKNVRIFAFHIKPIHYETIEKELKTVRKRDKLNIHIIEQGKTYRF